MDISPEEAHPDLPDVGDNTMDKIACIEEMLNRMQHVPQASDVFLKELVGLVNKEDINKMVEVQNHMLSRFEKTNEMLVNFNALSLARYETTCQEFKQHTQLLTTMKKDLDNVFKRIRNVKAKLSSQYPEAFNAVKIPRQLTEEDEEDISEGHDLPSKLQGQVTESASSSTLTAFIPTDSEVKESQRRSSENKSNDSSKKELGKAEIIEGED